MIATRRSRFTLRGVLDRPLTDVQWDLVSNNRGLLGLCYTKLAGRCPVPLNGLESEALMTCLENRLIRAAQEYDVTLGYAFSTFACKCLLWTGWQDFQRWTREQQASLSLDYEVTNPLLSGRVVTGLAYAPGTEEDAGDEIDFKARVAWMVGMVGEQTASWIVRRVVHGETLAEIARDVGRSKEAVRSRIERALTYMRQELERKAVAS